MEISLDNGNLVAALIKQINLVQRWNKAYRKALNLPRPLAQNSLWLCTTIPPSPLRSTPQPLRFINVIKNHKSSHVKRNSIVLPPLLLCDSFCCRRRGERGEGAWPIISAITESRGASIQFVWRFKWLSDTAPSAASAACLRLATHDTFNEYPHSGTHSFTHSLVFKFLVTFVLCPKPAKLSLG